MPQIKIVFLSLLAQAVIASAALAVPDMRTADICDRAARRAAQAEGVPLNIMQAVTRIETGRRVDGGLHPWPWTVNLEGKGYWFGSEAEAKAYVFDVFKSGARSFDVGCFQINYRWHGKAFQSIDAMFDPDQNAAYAARFLKQLHAEHGGWSAAVGAYHSRTPEHARKYVDRFHTVMAALSDAPDQAARQIADPFHRTGLPLIPLGPSPTGAARPALGSLVPASGTAVAFITFDQE